jgi:GTP-binding protein
VSRLRFTNATFIKSAASQTGWPQLLDSRGEPFPEIAVAGRSNVGKSSLLNHLLCNQSLARISSTPGKTQLLNFFSVDEQIALVDLPGYGYAKVPPKVKQTWGAMIETYLAKREPLQLLLFLLDIRRTPNQDDLKFLEWAAYQQLPLILVLTKVDKITKNQRVAATHKVLRELPYDNLQWVHYSVLKDIGRKELIQMIVEALAEKG